MRYEELLEMEPDKLLLFLAEQFYETLPESICTIEDMENASKMMLRLSSSFSFLTQLLAMAKIKTRIAKREQGLSEDGKIKYEDMVDRKEVIINIVEGIKNQYAAISRAVTIHIENNQELKMNSSARY